MEETTLTFEEETVADVTAANNSRTPFILQYSLDPLISSNTNQFHLDFPGSPIGIPGTYLHRTNDEFELEQTELLGTPEYLIGDHYDEHNDPSSGVDKKRVVPRLRFGRYKDFNLRTDHIHDVVTETWKELPENEGKDGIVSGAESLRQLLDACYTEPNPKARARRVKAFRDKYPGIFHEFVGDDVTGSTPLPKPRRRYCLIQ